jgi:retinol dehydrogenase 12
LHPGLVATDFGEVGGVVSFGWFFVKPWGISPEDGAKTSVYVASAPELAGQSGGYYRLSRPAAPNPLADDADLARRMWEYSARVTA